MNISQFLAHVKTVSKQIDIRAFLHFCRVTDIMSLLKTPAATDSDACKQWVKTWATAWKVLRELEIEGVELGSESAIRFLGNTCQDDMLWGDLHPVVGMVLSGQASEYVRSAIDASDTLALRMEFCKTAPGDVLQAIQAMLAATQAVEG